MQVRSPPVALPSSLLIFQLVPSHPLRKSTSAVPSFSISIDGSRSSPEILRMHNCSLHVIDSSPFCRTTDPASEDRRTASDYYLKVEGCCSKETRDATIHRRPFYRSHISSELALRFNCIWLNGIRIC